MRRGPRNPPENGPLRPGWHLFRLSLVAERYARAVAWAAAAAAQRAKDLLWEILDGWWEVAVWGNIRRRADEQLEPLVA